MPTIMNDGPFTDTFNWGAMSPGAFQVPAMPHDGWITRCRAYASTLSGSTQNCRLGVYAGLGDGASLLDQTASINLGTNIDLRDGSVNVKRSAGNDIRIAIMSDPTSGIIVDSKGNETAGSGTKLRVKNSVGSFSLPNTLNEDVHYDVTGRVGYEYIEQADPGKGDWASPTPAQNSSPADETPTFHGTMPHPNGDGAYDETNLFELRILNADTGAVLYQQQLTPTTAEKDGKYFDRTPKTFAPGTRVEADFRHRDSWDVWSPWSDKRTFTILDSTPLQGAWQSPTPAQNATINTSQPTFRGTTPHGTDAAYDWTTTVQLKLTNTDTGAVILDEQYSTTSAEQAGDFFERSPITISAGTPVTAQFRHMDRGGNWSLWSATRSFQISPGPDQPTLSRPKGKVNFRNETEYQAQGGSGPLYSGSYNNPTGAAMWGVRVQVWNNALTTKVADSGSTFIVRSATSGVWTLPQASFPSTGGGVVAHPAAFDYATTYKIRVKVQETASGGGAGIESDWSSYYDLTINSFPNAPTNLSPAGGIPTSLLQFAASVTDPDGDLITYAAMKIIDVASNTAINVPNRANNTVYALGDERTSSNASAPRAQALNAGKSTDTTQAFQTLIPAEGNTVKEIPATAVARSTAYTVGQCRLRPGDTTSAAVYVECTTAGTTAASAPAYSSTDGVTVTDGTAVFTVRTAITWRNMGPKSEHSMVVSGNNLTKTLSSTLLTLGNEYRWQARARDAVGWGAFSQTEVFTYAAVPTVDTLAPRLSQRVNLITDPSAEYEQTTPFWTSVGESGTARVIERTIEDAAYGDWCWKGTTDGIAPLRYQSPLITVDPTKPCLLQAEFKKLSGTSTSRLNLQCYNSSDVLISSVTPTSIAALNGIDVPANWTRYGGIVWPVGSSNTPALPAGTAKVKVDIYASDTTGAVVLWDGVAFEQLLETGWSTGQWSEAQKWFGYFDGDTESFDNTQATYYWNGTQGQSQSIGNARLTATDPSLYFRYTHVNNMNGRRLIIEKWRNASEDWKQIYDSGMVSASAVSGDIVAFPLPAAVLLNEERYRFTLSARDTLGVNGSGQSSVADTFYLGPVELPITGIDVDSVAAEITVHWTLSVLPALNFGGYEIQRVDSQGRTAILNREMNQSVTSFTDSYPLSQELYTYRVRQIELAGVDEKEGRWAKGITSVDYWPFTFVKDVESPRELYVAFETQADNLPAPEEDTISAVYAPWGQETPMVLKRQKMRLRTGQITAEFYPDAINQESETIRYEKMRRICERQNTICILMQEPDRERVFASLVGPWRKGFIPPRTRTIQFDYQENGYVEDIRDREDE